MMLASLQYGLILQDLFSICLEKDRLMATQSLSPGASSVVSFRRFVAPVCGTLLIVAGLAGTAWSGGDGGQGAPEIDPTSTISAMTLLTGGLLIVADRIRKFRSQRRD